MSRLGATAEGSENKPAVQRVWQPEAAGVVLHQRYPRIFFLIVLLFFCTIIPKYAAVMFLDAAILLLRAVGREAAHCRPSK